VLAAFRSTVSADEISSEGCGCLGQCGNGPNVLILPEQIRYYRVSQADVPIIIEQSIERLKRMNCLPTKLNCSINYSRGNYLSISWDGKVLQVDRMTGAKLIPLVEIAPSVESWSKFWTELDEIEIWNWDAEYGTGASAGACGGSWIVSIESGHKKIDAQGKNITYPAQFDRYEQALRDLTEC
jgi:(2Fe-2S) ferredoxin